MIPKPTDPITDKYGLSWQIVTAALMKLYDLKDKSKAKRAMAAMMTMQKLDIQVLMDAAAGKGAGSRRRAA